MPKNLIYISYKLDSRVSRTARQVLDCLLTFGDQTTDAAINIYPCDQTLATRMNMCERTIRRGKNELENLGIIIRTYNKNINRESITVPFAVLHSYYQIKLETIEVTISHPLVNPSTTTSILSVNPSMTNSHPLVNSVVTNCPAETTNTWTNCPAETIQTTDTWTNCPTQAPDIWTNCPEARTNCPAETTDIWTNCPTAAAETTDIRTNCPEVWTNCPTTLLKTLFIKKLNLTKDDLKYNYSEVTELTENSQVAVQLVDFKKASEEVTKDKTNEEMASDWLTQEIISRREAGKIHSSIIDSKSNTKLIEEGVYHMINRDKSKFPRLSSAGKGMLAMLESGLWKTPDGMIEPVKVVGTQNRELRAYDVPPRPESFIDLDFKRNEEQLILGIVATAKCLNNVGMLYELSAKNAFAAPYLQKEKIKFKMKENLSQIH